MRKPIFACIILMSILIVTCSHAAEKHRDTSVRIILDGKKLPVSPAPVLRKGRVFVPAMIFRKIGLSVISNNPRKAEVGWPDSDAIIDYQAGKRTYHYDVPANAPNAPLGVLPGTPFMHSGVLMIPLRSWIDNGKLPGGITAEWDSDTRTVHLYREMNWLRRRIAEDADYAKHPEWGYSHVWLGKNTPVVPGSEIARAKKLYAEGNHRKAIRMLDNLVQSDLFNWGSEPIRYRPEGEAYKPLGEMLLKENPDSYMAYLYLGIGLALEKDLAGAEDAFRKGVEANPRSEMLQFAVGWVILRQESVSNVFDRKPETLQAAMGYFEKALKINEDYVPALRNAGWTSLALAYLTEQAGGYTDESRVQAIPYLRKSAGCFEHLLERTSPSPRLSEMVSQIKRQLAAAEKMTPKRQSYSRPTALATRQTSVITCANASGVSR